MEELEETETEERLPDENKECILIIDDTADVRGYVKSLLKEEYTVIEAEMCIRDRHITAHGWQAAISVRSP